MQQQYYYLISSLAELTIDTGKKPLSIIEFLNFCSEEMNDNDFNNLKKIFLFNDIKNLIYYKGEGAPFITPSYYSEEDFKENLKDVDAFFPFISEYFYNEKNEKRLYPELIEIDEIVLLLYLYINDFTHGFIKDYFLFELDLQNVTTALSLRENNLPLLNKIIPYEDYSEQMKKNSSPNFGLSKEIDYIEKLLDVYKMGDLIKIEKTTEEIRWNWLEQRVGHDYFSCYAVFAYAVRLSSVERWIYLNEKKGEETLNNLINDIELNVKFPIEF